MVSMKYNHYITYYEVDNTISDYQFYLICVPSGEETKVMEWIEIYCGPLNEGGAHYSDEVFILEGDNKILFDNRIKITHGEFNFIKEHVCRMYEYICDLSRNLRTLVIEQRHRVFGEPKSNVYININGNIYINPVSYYDYLEIEHDVCDSLSSRSILDPLNLFWFIGNQHSISIKFGSDLRYLESEIGIDYDIKKHTHNSTNGRYINIVDGSLLLYAIYGYYSSIINTVFDRFCHHIFYDNGRKRDFINLDD